MVLVGAGGLVGWWVGGLVGWWVVVHIEAACANVTKRFSPRQVRFGKMGHGIPPSSSTVGAGLQVST
jgi:hypothetical protein